MTGCSKICNVCKEEKNLDDFHRNSQNKDGCACYCKECKKEYDAEYNKKRRKRRPRKPRVVVVADFKICTKCKEKKSIDEFSPDSRNVNGHGSWCKECINKYSAEYRAKNLERVREQDRERDKGKERMASKNQRTKRWKKENLHKVKAEKEARRAIKTGKIVKTPCVRCGRSDYVCGHHEDYDKPLDVVWLCTPCHHQRHKEMKKEKTLLLGHTIWDNLLEPEDDLDDSDYLDATFKNN